MIFLTFTFLWCFIKFVSSRTFALKRPNSINAISSLTEPRDGLAFIHICQISGYRERRGRDSCKSLQKKCDSLSTVISPYLCQWVICPSQYLEYDVRNFLTTTRKINYLSNITWSIMFYKKSQILSLFLPSVFPM